MADRIKIMNLPVHARSMTGKYKRTVMDEGNLIYIGCNGFFRAELKRAINRVIKKNGATATLTRTSGGVRRLKRVGKKIYVSHQFEKIGPSCDYYLLDDVKFLLRSLEENANADC